MALDQSKARLNASWGWTRPGTGNGVDTVNGVAPNINGNVQINAVDVTPATTGYGTSHGTGNLLQLDESHADGDWDNSLDGGTFG